MYPPSLLLPTSLKSQLPSPNSLSLSLPVINQVEIQCHTMMKQSHYSCFLFIILLFNSYLSSSSSARLLATQLQAENLQQVKLSTETNGGEENIEMMMGAEVCDPGDKKCLKRRILSEAHLDYIYTQHHNQP